MSRILLTGTTGLVGKRLSAALAVRHEVYGICRQPSDHAPFTPVVIDLASGWRPDLLPPKIDAIVHLAQSNRWQEFPEGAIDMFAVNVAATAKLLDYALRAGARRFVLASTGGLYGNAPEAVNESSPIHPAGGPLRYYFETKRAAELLALSYQQQLFVSVLRPFFIYGPGQRQPKLIPRLVDHVRRGTAIRLRGDAGTLLNPAQVEDVVDVIEACLRVDQQGVINVGGGQVTAIRSMALRIGELIGAAPVFEREDGPAESFVTDVTGMRRLLGRDPIRFDDGIAMLLADGGRA